MMRLAACLLLLLATEAHASVDVKHWTLQGTAVTLVVADMATNKVDIGLAEGTVVGKHWRSESFSHMVNRVKPTAAMTGPYFDMATNKPVCALVKDGQLLVDGLCHSYLQITDRASVEYMGSSRARDIPAGLPVGIGGGPILVRGAVVHNNKRDEGFSDAGIFGSARRTAVGCTAAGKVVLFVTTTEIGLGRWSRIAKDAGLTDAINMDGGGSAALYANGRYWCRPSRRLTNWIVIGDKP